MAATATVRKAATRPTMTAAPDAVSRPPQLVAAEKQPP
jgi:hypothetical protein